MSYTIEEIEKINTDASVAQRDHAQAEGQVATLAKQLTTNHHIRGKTPEAILNAAATRLNEMETEGKAMADDLETEARNVQEALRKVEETE